MTITKGQLLYYGGLIGMGVLIVSFMIMLLIFRKQKAKMIKKIENEF